eukprot:TRINITY_DN8745_c0_g1_i1.p1 TRINITY_DN8745_c0_g1~~TRINITY_DN8745_c0_g1_i1.p1  ORF type:complete len:112 (-),score=11.70 TRINITY_DN8745_c0_g1_i1:591-926(-)
MGTFSEEGFENEVKHYKSLQHKKIVNILGRVRGEFAIIVDFCEQGTLSDAIRNRAEFSTLTKIHLACDIAEGLHYIHSHRDSQHHTNLHTKNILLTTYQTKRVKGSLKKTL